MVLNVSEMEAKVREATNDEPWYASSLLFSYLPWPHQESTFEFI